MSLSQLNTLESVAIIRTRLKAVRLVWKFTGHIETPRNQTRRFRPLLDSDPNYGGVLLGLRPPFWHNVSMMRRKCAPIERLYLSLIVRNSRFPRLIMS